MLFRSIAALRAEWATLENPARVQGLVRRHSSLRPAEATQFDTLDNLPIRPPTLVRQPPPESIASIIENIDADTTTGSVPAWSEQR